MPTPFSPILLSSLSVIIKKMKICFNVLFLQCYLWILLCCAVKVTINANACRICIQDPLILFVCFTANMCGVNRMLKLVLRQTFLQSTIHAKLRSKSNAKCLHFVQFDEFLSRVDLQPSNASQNQSLVLHTFIFFFSIE